MTASKQKDWQFVVVPVDEMLELHHTYNQEWSKWHLSVFNYAGPAEAWSISRKLDDGNSEAIQGCTELTAEARYKSMAAMRDAAALNALKQHAFKQSTDSGMVAVSRQQLEHIVKLMRVYETNAALNEIESIIRSTNQ